MIISKISSDGGDFTGIIEIPFFSYILSVITSLRPWSTLSMGQQEQCPIKFDNSSYCLVD